MQPLIFRLIVGETLICKLVRKGLPVSYGLLGMMGICFLVPQVGGYLMTPLTIVYSVLLLTVATIEFSGIKLFITEGVIQLNDEGIEVHGQKFAICDLNDVKIKFTYARGQGAGRNGSIKSNVITILVKNSSEPLVMNTLVETREQREELARLLKMWRKKGVKLSADGIDLV